MITTTGFLYALEQRVFCPVCEIEVLIGEAAQHFKSEFHLEKASFDHSAGKFIPNNQNFTLNVIDRGTFQESQVASKAQASQDIQTFYDSSPNNVGTAVRYYPISSERTPSNPSGQESPAAEDK